MAWQWQPKPAGKQNGLCPGRVNMATKFSTADVADQLDRFRKIAPDFDIKFGELKADRYVHILRDGKIIGCFGLGKNGIEFEFHNSYPDGRKKVLVKNLTDEDIKNAILRTPGN